MAKQTAVAKAVKDTARDSTVQNVSVTIKDEEGNDRLIERKLHSNVLAIITQGMDLSNRLEKTWSENCDVLVAEFFGDVVTNGLASAEILKMLREDKENLAVMYAVFQTRHPDWAEAQSELQSAKNAAAGAKTGEGSKEADRFQARANELLVKIRRTANNQAIKVCHYFAQKHGASLPSEQRDQPGARQLIEAFRKDLSARVIDGRGVWKLQAEKDLANAAIDALTQVLADDRYRVASAMPTSTLGIVAPDANAVGRAAVAMAQKAGTVRKISAEEYAATANN